MERFDLNLAVRRLCRERGIKVADVAAEAAMLASNLRHIMAKGNPRLETLERVADAFGLRLDELISKGYLK